MSLEQAVMSDDHSGGGHVAGHIGPNLEKLLGEARKEHTERSIRLDEVSEEYQDVLERAHEAYKAHARNKKGRLRYEQLFGKKNKKKSDEAIRAMYKVLVEHHAAEFNYDPKNNLELLKKYEGQTGPEWDFLQSIVKRYFGKDATTTHKAISRLHGKNRGLGKELYAKHLDKHPEQHLGELAEQINPDEPLIEWSRLTGADKHYMKLTGEKAPEDGTIFMPNQIAGGIKNYFNTAKEREAVDKTREAYFTKRNAA
jgi:hypothetical protein